MNLSFYYKKRVFVTGHTGFKGAWLCHILKRAGAVVTGYALPAESGSLFELISAADGMTSRIGDIRDTAALTEAFRGAQPELVIHMAAQPIVLDSYERPVYTFETNVIGTANLLDCVHKIGGVKSIVNVTTDKVYRNNEWAYGYRETDALGGHDPYAASKACSELVTESYAVSFLRDEGIAVSTVRAGNVIGGGDFSKNRIVPDCVRAAEQGLPISVRNPRSVRPYQHVLEPLFAYLMVAQRQRTDSTLAGSYNVGPGDADCVTTGELAAMFCETWKNGQTWDSEAAVGAPHEAGLLLLDCSKIRSVFGWRPKWNIGTALAKTVEWEKARIEGSDVREVMSRQIEEYEKA